jgi:hypothetical protein
MRQGKWYEGSRGHRSGWHTPKKLRRSSPKRRQACAESHAHISTQARDCCPAPSVGRGQEHDILHGQEGRAEVRRRVPRKVSMHQQSKHLQLARGIRNPDHYSLFALLCVQKCHISVCLSMRLTICPNDKLCAVTRLMGPTAQRMSARRIQAPC